MFSRILPYIIKPSISGLSKTQSKLIKLQSLLPMNKSNVQLSTGKISLKNLSELTTLRQMQKFNKKNFGIKVFDVKDKELGKYLTEGIAKFYNSNGSQFKVPKNFIVCDLPNANGYMYYEPTKDVLAISQKHINKFREIASVNGETLEQTLKKWGNTQLDGTLAEYRGRYFELYHEFGHKAHHAVCKNYGNMGLDWSKQEFQDIAAKVSLYSKNSPEEFVADTFALLSQRKILPLDVIQLYEKCGGPQIKGVTNSKLFNSGILSDFGVNLTANSSIDFSLEQVCKMAYEC